MEKRDNNKNKLLTEPACNITKPARTKVYENRVTLTQISAYITHKNLALCKIMEMMHTSYTKCGTQSRHVSNYT